MHDRTIESLSLLFSFSVYKIRMLVTHVLELYKGNKEMRLLPQN